MLHKSANLLKILTFGLITFSSFFAQASSLCESQFDANPVAIQRARPSSFHAFLQELRIQWIQKKEPFVWENGDTNTLKYDAYTLQVTLGKIDRTQFDALKARYNNLSEVTYSPDRIYELIDFLPPLMQALNSLQLVPVRHPFKWPAVESIVDDGSVEIMDLLRWSENKYQPLSLTNCWGTTIAIQRNLSGQSHQLETGWVSRTSIGGKLTSEKYFSEVKASDIQFGDIMLVHSMNPHTEEVYLQHAATVIEPGLIFEKTDSSADDVFRIALESDSVEKLRLILGSSTTVTYHRLKPGAALPSLKESESGINRIEDFGRYLTNEQLSQLIIGYELGLSGKIFGQVSSLGAVSTSRDPKTGRYVLTAKSQDEQTILKQFRRPKRTKE